MLNVAQITSRLAMMPDAALQQYAALHKEDPYIMALAVSESNRRKQMRNAAQVPQGGEMPKVADQALAEMSPEEQPPEEQGIARLPTGDMNFAGGGIVAFADGGDVERYQAGGLPPSMGTEYGIPGMTSGDAYTRAMAKYQRNEPLTDVEKALLFASAPLAAAVDVAALPLTGLANLVRNPLDTSPRISLTPAMDARNRRLYGAPSPETATSAATANAITAAYPGRGRREAGAPAQTSAGQRLAPTDKEPPARERTPAPAAGSAAAAPKAGGFDMSPKGLMALRKQLGEDISVEEPANLRAAREALAAEEIAAAKEVKTSLERDQAKFADAFKGREERLAKREAQIGKDRDTNTGLAFLNAGLAIMSTPGSLATAIGKGARVGTEQYAAGLDKLRAAQDKLEEARDRLDELKLNRDMMDAKEIRAAEAGIRAAATEGKKRGVAALEKMFDVSNKRADSMFTTLAETGLTMYREGEATKRSNASIAAAANAPERQVFDALVRKHGGDRVAAYQELTATKREPMTREAALKKWMEPGAEALIKAQYPNIKTFDDYYAILSGGTGLPAAGADQFRVVGVR